MQKKKKKKKKKKIPNSLEKTKGLEINISR